METLFWGMVLLIGIVLGIVFMLITVCAYRYKKTPAAQTGLLCQEHYLRIAEASQGVGDVEPIRLYLQQVRTYQLGQLRAWQSLLDGSVAQYPKWHDGRVPTVTETEEIKFLAQALPAKGMGEVSLLLAKISKIQYGLHQEDKYLEEEQKYLTEAEWLRNNRDPKFKERVKEIIETED